MEQRLIDPEVQKVYDGVVPESWFEADPNYITRIGTARYKKFLKDADDRRALAMAECKDPRLFDRRARRVSLDGTLRNESWLHGATGLDHVLFFYIVACFEHEIKTTPDVPLFRHGLDPERASDRGNRCILAAEHMVCMTLYHIWTGCSQESLQGMFWIDQTTASRNIRLVRGIMANSGMLPTDLGLMDELRSFTKEKVRAYVGDTLLVDLTHYDIEDPVDKDSNKEAYSHKAGTTTCKSVHACAKRGLVVLSGELEGGRGSEIEYLRRHFPDVGVLTASLTSPDTPAAERTSVYIDNGPQGIKELLKGANVLMPHRKPIGGELTEEQKAYNSQLAAERAPVENRFAEIKQNKILAHEFRGSVEDLRETRTVCIGFVNLKLIMRGADGFVPDTHAKEAADGPGPPGPRGRKPRQTFPYLAKE